MATSSQSMGNPLQLSLFNCTGIDVDDRNLSLWAENGVLLLNTCLTVRAREANSHSKKGWEQFTDKVIEMVDQYGGANLQKSGIGQGVVFLAWGNPAAKRVAKLSKV